MDFSSVLSQVVSFLNTCISWVNGLFVDVIFAYWPIGIVVSFVVLMPVVYGLYRLISR